MDESKDAYVYRLDIPNLKDNELNINIDENGINIEGDFSQLVEKKDLKGNVIAKHEIHRTLSKHIALPKEADRTKAKIEKNKDEVVIRIPRRPSYKAADEDDVHPLRIDLCSPSPLVKPNVGDCRACRRFKAAVAAL